MKEQNSVFRLESAPENCSDYPVIYQPGALRTQRKKMCTQRLRAEWPGFMWGKEIQYKKDSCWHVSTRTAKRQSARRRKPACRCNIYMARAGNVACLEGDFLWYPIALHSGWFSRYSAFRFLFYAVFPYDFIIGHRPGGSCGFMGMAGIQRRILPAEPDESSVMKGGFAERQYQYFEM